jgi:hypothetical protein
MPHNHANKTQDYYLSQIILLLPKETKNQTDIFY